MRPVLRARYALADGGSESLAEFDQLMSGLCLDPKTVERDDPATPAGLGSAIARTVLDVTRNDGSLEGKGYESSGYESVNEPLVVAESGTVMADPNRWQPLSLKESVTQNLQWATYRDAADPGRSFPALRGHPREYRRSGRPGGRSPGAGRRPGRSPGATSPGLPEIHPHYHGRCRRSRMGTMPEPTHVHLIDVSPRDGLQNESVQVSTSDKLALIESLIAGGVTAIEAASFVSPTKVPAMADSDVLMREVPRVAGVRYIGLVMNQRGLDRAFEADVDEVNIVVSASDTFSLRNQGLDTLAGVSLGIALANRCQEEGVDASMTIATAFGCPFEGEVPATRLAEVVKLVSGTRLVRLNLGDTIGVAVPADVIERFKAISPYLQPSTARGAHFHNTRNTGYANAYAALTVGVSHFDASVGGIGGCPFAPNATGNVATEDLGYMFDRMGLDTGLHLEALMGTSRWLEGPLGKSLPALLGRAGLFPADGAESE